MIQTCYLCLGQFEVDAIQPFCSPQCEQTYWNSPPAAEITTECPQCHEAFMRTVFTVEVAAYQALTVCPKCAEQPTVLLSRKYKWEATS